MFPTETSEAWYVAVLYRHVEHLAVDQQPSHLGDIPVNNVIGGHRW